ncbi:hypothetical protein [Streptomyces sp. R-74717]|uniref:ABC transporter ATP-binding protein n=1 Tax=Streptomyces sp. R-74717 TaxID=2969820 RepID=UPI0039B4A741
MATDPGGGGKVARIADPTAALRNGAVVETGPTSDLLTAPEHPYTRALFEASARVLRATRTRPPARGNS